MAYTIKGASGVRLGMQLVVAAAAICWLLFFFFQPITTTSNWEKVINDKVQSKFLNMRGSTFLLQVLPIIVIAFVSYFILELRRRLTKPSAKVMTGGKMLRIARSPWTFPIFVKGPLGMLTPGDLVFLLVTLFIIFWYFIKSAVKSSNEIDHKPVMPGMPPRYMQKLWQIGILLGNTAVIPMALLWIPVSRGSPILQVVGVPFERAVKYHTWLGYLTVCLLIAHGGVITGYFVHGHKAHELITWSTHGVSVSVVAGVVALAAGIIMMLTAMGLVRRRFFELFFATHQLYLVFLIFFFFHTVVKVHYLIIPVLIFLMDRFMRAVQSRKTVDVLSAKVQKSGIIELKFAKAANATYHALSFVYVLLPSVSRLHWHPFSVASSPLDDRNEITIYIKPLGGFTKNLHDILISSKRSTTDRDFYKCPFSFKVGLEGPYGDESAFYLRYKNLVMVAGGIGVTPLLAILRDILHRYRLRQAELPYSIQLIFCVRNASELQILDDLNPSSILPNYELHLKIRVDAYVTSSTGAQHDTNLPIGQEMDDTDIDDYNAEIAKKLSAVSPREMSTISSSGHSTWVAATFASTIVGFFVTNGMFNLTALEKWNLPNYVRVLIYITSFTVAVVVFGGAVLLLWALVEKRAQKNAQISAQISSNCPWSELSDDRSDIENRALPTNEPLWMDMEAVTYGKRPVWKDIFSFLKTKHEALQEDVGVLVSGAKQMQEDVASEFAVRNGGANIVTVVKIDLRSRRWMKVAAGPPASLRFCRIYTEAYIENDCLLFAGEEVGSGFIAYDVKNDQWSRSRGPADARPIHDFERQGYQGPFYFQPGLNPFSAF